jgi:RNA polymerase sigma-70 factor (ECF subfamily)
MEPELLQRFARGDLEAFEALFRQFQGVVYRWVVRVVRDPGVAEDLTVEAFWRIYKAHGRFDPRRGFEPWARRIATNAALDHLRTARPEAALDPERVPAPPVKSQEISPAIRNAFDELPAKLRVVATLALIEELPYAEIADALDISVSAVKMREFRAVRMLREKLKKMGIES